MTNQPSSGRTGWRPWSRRPAGRTWGSWRRARPPRRRACAVVSKGFTPVSVGALASPTDAEADDRVAPSHRAPCRHGRLALPRRARPARNLLVLAAAARHLAGRGRAHRRARVRQSRLHLPASAARAAAAALAAGGDVAARRQRRGQGRPRRRGGRERASVRDAAQGGSTRRCHRLRPDRGEPPDLRHLARPAAPRRASHPPRRADSRGPASGTLGRDSGRSRSSSPSAPCCS